MLLELAISQCLTPFRMELKHRSGAKPSQRLLPLSIMKAQLRASLKPLEHHGNILPRGLMGLFN